MFGDLLQALHARKMVRAHERLWMICYVVGSLKDADDRVLALAVKCSETGDIAAPAATQLIVFKRGDMVTSLPDGNASGGPPR